NISGLNTWAGNVILQNGAITSVSNAAGTSGLITVTIPNHGLVSGHQVQIAGVLGDTAANGIWKINVLNSNQFTLNGSNGNGAYISGGLWSETDSIGADASTTLTVTGKVQDPSTPAVVPVANLLKVGPGTLIFPNPNLYTGLTTVANGILNVP